MLTVYSIFLAQIFLGIVVGHFEVEWKRVEAIHNSNKDQSYNVIAIIYRILSTHFKAQAKLLDEQEALEKEEKGDMGNQEEEENRSRCSCPCTWSSLNPSGIFERIVLYCMRKVCKKKSSQAKNDDEDSDEDREASNDEQILTQAQETKSSNSAKQAQGDPNQPKARLPFNPEFGWGTPKALKASSEFRSHSGVKTYLNWFDGFAINLFQQDKDTLAYFERNKIDRGYVLKQNIPEAEIFEQKQRKPQSI